MALTVGAYAAPTWQRPIAVAAVVGLTAVNYLGVRKTAGAHPDHRRRRARRAGARRGRRRVRRDRERRPLRRPRRRRDRPGSCGPPGCCSSPSPATPASPRSARRSTTPPARSRRPSLAPSGSRSSSTPSSPSARSPPSAPTRCSRSDAPLATAVRAGDLDGLVPAVRIGGTIAALGVLLSLIAGVSRTAFAMAADRELPGWLDAVHPVHKVPHRAELAAGALVALLVVVTDLRGAIGFSSFCVLDLLRASPTPPPGRSRDGSGGGRAHCPWPGWSDAHRSHSRCPSRAWRREAPCSPPARSSGSSGTGSRADRPGVRHGRHRGRRRADGRSHWGAAASKRRQSSLSKDDSDRAGSLARSPSRTSTSPVAPLT